MPHNLRPVQEAIAGSPLGAIPIFAGPVAGPSYFVAGVVLTIMILPILTSVARDSIRATPRLQREGAMALGATHWETIRHVVLPFARGGIFAGIILGLSRAIGETIAVLFVIGNQPQINASIFSPGWSLRITCFSNLIWSPSLRASNHARPQPCAWRLVMTSFWPSPLTS